MCPRPCCHGRRAGWVTIVPEDCGNNYAKNVYYASLICLVTEPNRRLICSAVVPFPLLILIFHVTLRRPYLSQFLMFFLHLSSVFICPAWTHSLCLSWNTCTSGVLLLPLLNRLPFQSLLLALPLSAPPLVGDCRVHYSTSCNGGQWPWGSLFIRWAGLLR